MATEREGLGFSNMFLAFVSGAAAGAALAFFTAPRSGAESRRLVGEGFRDRSTRLAAAARDRTASISRLPPAVRQAYNAGAIAAKEAFAEAYQDERAPVGIEPQGLPESQYGAEF